MPPQANYISYNRNSLSRTRRPTSEYNFARVYREMFLVVDDLDSTLLSFKTPDEISR